MDVKKILVESVVERTIRAFSDDPRRAVRKLLDLGRQNTKGGFRSRFLEFSEAAMADEDSPYYQMLQNAIRQIDRETLKSVCVNIGYNSWSKGTRQLRAIREKTGAALPWSVAFHLDGTTGEEELRRCGALLDLGERTGVYCYSFLPTGGFDCEDWLTGLMLAHRECAFFLLLPTDVSGWDLERLHLVHNTVVLVNTDGAGWQQTLASLSESGCMSGIYRRFAGEADVEEIVSGRWLEQTAGQSCLCAFALAGETAEDGLCDKVRAYVEHSWSDPAAPAFVVDYYRDFSTVSEIIVGEPVFAGVTAQGILTRSDGRRELPGEGTLEELLAAVGQRA